MVVSTLLRAIFCVIATMLSCELTPCDRSKSEFEARAGVCETLELCNTHDQSFNCCDHELQVH